MRGRCKCSKRSEHEVAPAGIKERRHCRLALHADRIDHAGGAGNILPPRIDHEGSSSYLAYLPRAGLGCTETSLAGASCRGGCCDLWLACAALCLRSTVFAQLAGQAPRWREGRPNFADAAGSFLNPPGTSALRVRSRHEHYPRIVCGGHSKNDKKERFTIAFRI